MEQVVNGCNVLRPYMLAMVPLSRAFGPTHLQSYKDLQRSNSETFCTFTLILFRPRHH